MERLTFDGSFCDIAQCTETPGGSFCEDGCCSQREVWERLKQYEDTGYTPEVFQSYVVFLQDLIGSQKASEALDRFRWLAEADRDGRLVVLPCKVGDTVWSSLDGAKYARECKVDFVNIGNVGTTFVLSAKNGLREQYGVTATAFGKTVFLTREEAWNRRADNGNKKSV